MMTAALAIAAGLYLLLGHVFWRKTVLPVGPLPRADHAEAADEAVRAWQHEARVAEARGDVALLVVKAAFVLLWPLALAYGFIWVRVT